MIRDPQRRPLLFLARVADKDFCDVHARHLRAALRDQPRVVSFAAADIEPLQSIHRRQHRHERRRVQVVAIGVVARARELRPSLGIAVPTISDREVIHGVMPTRCNCYPPLIHANADPIFGRKKAQETLHLRLRPHRAYRRAGDFFAASRRLAPLWGHPMQKFPRIPVIDGATVVLSIIGFPGLNRVVSTRFAPNASRMTTLLATPRASTRPCLFRPAAPLLLGLAGLLAGGCFSTGARGPRKTERSSSVVAYLYPDQANPLPPTSIPVLRLPLRVGIAFVPTGTGKHSYYSDTGVSEQQKSLLLERVAAEFRGRDYIQSIELVPSTYLRAGGGFDNLNQVRSLLGVDVIALVAYDQVQFTNTNFLSLSYWTIVGAYIFQGNKNDTQTMMEAAVYDIPSRHLLFRAPGAEPRRGRRCCRLCPTTSPRRQRRRFRRCDDRTRSPT